MNLYTDLDDPIADDAATITAINHEFARVHYTRPQPLAHRTSRPTMLTAGGLAAASIAVIAVVAVSPADRHSAGPLKPAPPPPTRTQLRSSCAT